jgi:hypothetical protein
VCVEDTGVGIPADRLGTVFEPFVQADMRLTRTHGGLGLGLAISRRLARRMRGNVTGRSEAGAGATFCLWLPAPPETPAPRTTRSAADRAVQRTATAGATPDAFRAVADAVLGELERISFAYVARLRTDPGTPSARAGDEAQLEDHVASFLGNLAGSLPALGEAALAAAPGRATSRQAAALHDVQDGAAIQRVVAERHGAQRARLGWGEGELRREHTILREELAAAIRRRTARDRTGPAPEAGQQEAARALDALTEFLAAAERSSLTGYRAAVAARR